MARIACRSGIDLGAGAPESIDAPADVRAHSPVPIAAGERWFEPARFIEALNKESVDILQPDVSHAGRMGETKRVAHLAHRHPIPVAPHNPMGPVMNAMTLHSAVAIPNASEDACARFPYADHDVPLFDGTIDTRDRPGRTNLRREAPPPASNPRPTPEISKTSISPRETGPAFAFDA